MAKEPIQRVQSVLGEAAAVLESLAQVQARLSEIELTEEASWAFAGWRRLEKALARTRELLVDAAGLPELAAFRAARTEPLLQRWVETLEALLDGLTTHISAGTPLIPALFPHSRFDKLRRGGNPARSFLEEFKRRRSSGYVTRLAADSEYAFLPVLLEPVDLATNELEQSLSPRTLSEEEADELRNGVLGQAEALKQTMAQARLLAQAALANQPEWLMEFGLVPQPRRRTATDSSGPPTTPSDDGRLLQIEDPGESIAPE